MMKKIFALVMGVTLLASIAAGCGNPSPAETIDKAMDNRKSMHADYESSVDFILKPSDQLPEILNNTPVTITAKGGVDLDLSNGKHNARGDIKISGLDLIRVAMEMAGGVDSQSRIASLLDAAANINSFVIVDNTNYVKVGDTWYTVDSATLLTLAGTLGEDLDFSNVHTSCYADAMQDNGHFGADTMYKSLTELSAEQIDGVDTRHFRGSVDFDKILAELSSVARECGNPDAAAWMEATKPELTMLFQQANVEMWIDSSNNLRQVKTDLVIDGARAQTVIGILSGIGTAQIPGFQLDTVVVSTMARFSQFDASFNVTKPEGQASIGKLDVLLGTTGGTGVPTGAARTGSDLSGLSEDADSARSSTNTTTRSRTATTSSY